MFFRSVFDGSHPAFGGKDVWLEPASDIYPSLPLRSNPTVLDGADWSADPVSLRLCRLANLHYWCVLVLINLSYVGNEPRLMGRALAHMKGGLYPLAQLLSGRTIGVPFDAIGLNFGTGSAERSTFQWAGFLIAELQSLERQLPDDLPLPYSKAVAVMTARLIAEKANALLA